MTGLDPPPATCIDELQRQRMLGAEEHNGQDKAFPCREPTYKFTFETKPKVPSTKRVPSAKDSSGKRHDGHFECLKGGY